jgi:hypothetical protein
MAERMQGFRLLPENMRKCGLCDLVKDKSEFYKDKSRASGVSSRCKSCQNDYLKSRRADPEVDTLSTRRKWREANREVLQEQDRAYKEANRERLTFNEARRRARKHDLPDTLTFEELDEIVRRFNGKCAICDEAYEHLDHFIPISSGHGGTVKENMVPLCKSHNTSKHARNPFMWADNYLSEHERERFDALVSYLTEINGIAGVGNYEAHVHQCFK